MTAHDQTCFQGFPADLPVLLSALESNNSREWFHANKARYDHHVKRPVAMLAEAIAPVVAGIDARALRKFSRPNRDIRFSANKAPYRCVAWLAFCRPVEAWTDRPAYFLEVTPTQCRWGMGFYSAKPTTMSRLRTLLSDNPEPFLAALTALRERGFAVEGESYRRPPAASAGLPPLLADILGRKNCYMNRSSGYCDHLRSGAFAASVADDFLALAPLYQLFCRVVGPPG
ncbi:conserved hypothetical protein [Candidatus Terasakiella magnetica]|nr:conserved hypothetical protein [Candidatus Terasakiella magnetica]